MSSTRRTRGTVNTAAQTRRSNTTNLDKIAAKAYVVEVKELRKRLKEIQKKYRDAKAIAKNPPNEKAREKAINDMRHAELDKAAIVFPLPKRAGERAMNINVIREIGVTERWKIIATVMLWRRELSSKRKPLSEAVDKFNAALEPIEFREQMKFFTRRRDTDNSPDIIDGNDLRGRYGKAAPDRAPSYKSKESPKSMVFGFPKSSPLPPPPPNYKLLTDSQQTPPPPGYGYYPDEGGSRTRSRTRTVGNYKYKKSHHTKRHSTKKRHNRK
jgi:hypothetical protein